MRSNSSPTRGLLGALGLAGLLLAGCSAGSGPRSTQTVPDFEVESISIIEGSPWQINRPIDIVFNKPVDFATVSLNTINIVDSGGGVATGTFLQPLMSNGLVDQLTVRFQPACPTLPDFSDAGLKPDGVSYILHVLGSLSGGVTVRSTDGDLLEQGALVNFTTPVGNEPLALFLDTVPGPPAVRVRGAAGIALDEEAATHLQLGGNPDNRVYFQQNVITQLGELPAGFLVPLNKYSEVDTQFAVMVYFNQPVVATTANISSDRIVLEYQAVPGETSSWTPMLTRVELLENCTENGSVVKVSPLGLAPQNRPMRVNVRQGFSDLTGDLTPADTTTAARMNTTSVNNPGTLDPEEDADEIVERFTFSGSEDGSREDTTSAFATPRAIWGDGRLQASFNFGGTGGPGSDFDWVIGFAGQETVVLDTTSSQILGGPNGVPTINQTVINGVVDVNDFVIRPGSRLIIIGPNPCTILASGTVRIEGEISIAGGDSPGVGTLNTTNQPEVGANGNGGGGKGGTASFLTSQSTPRGGTGVGAFNQANLGGQGGESSYANTGLNNRRAAGGGGGRFGPDVLYGYQGDIARCQTLIGMDAESGRGGGPGGLGAISQSVRAQGGAIGPEPFTDTNQENNFFGTMITRTGELIVGELTRVYAGAGGGGGGDAVNSSSFPLTPFNIGGDEKGAGGGGGGGGLRILAIGEIVVVDGGRVTADGGHGGGGENTSFFDRVGGGSGGGSAGHIVFSSASFVQINGAATSALWYGDDPLAPLHTERPVSALGGQGGAGNGNNGGANETGNTTWRCDSIPLNILDLNANGCDAPDIPPMGPNCSGCFVNPANFNDPLGPVLAAGGDGSPGLIQFHVDNPRLNLQFPTLSTAQGGALYGGDPVSLNNPLDVSGAVAPPPMGWIPPQLVPPDAVDQGWKQASDNMVPFFGRTSVAQSDWIPIGLAKVTPAVGFEDQVTFFFGGTDGAGKIMRTGTEVDQLPPVIAPATMDAFDVTPPFVQDAVTLVFDASGLPDPYKANAGLATNYTIVLDNAGAQSLFEVAAVSFDVGAVGNPADDRLICTIKAGGTDLSGFDGGFSPSYAASLLPHFFRMSTNGVLDNYPDNTAVTIEFDATNHSVDGPIEIDGNGTAGGPFADITSLNGLNYDYVRFRVTFDLNADSLPTGVDLNTPRPSLLFLRMPFVF
jgi:hypothetical protein